MISIGAKQTGSTGQRAAEKQTGSRRRKFMQRYLEEIVDFDNRKKGTVILVSAGPGDPGLLTVKGREALAKADCIIYDRLASPELLLAAKEGCELIYVGKADHHHVLPQDKINELLAEKANEHSLVVRLKGGDAYVFGRGGEEGIYLAEHGIDFSVIPGVTSAIAGPAAAGIPITHRGIATGFHVMTAHGKEDRLTDIDFSRLTDEKETCVFLMGLRHVREVAENLIRAGRSADTPAAVISHATTAEQRTCIGTLSDIAAKVEREVLTSPAIIVVGEVVTLAGKLGGNRTFPGHAGESENDSREMKTPLCDRQQTADRICQWSVGTNLTEKTLIVPYIKGLDSTRKSLAEQLREGGAAVCEIPVGEIRICPFALPHEIPAVSGSNDAHSFPSQADMPDWMIFTSRNAVEGFFLQLREKEIDVRSLAHTKIAAVGEQTVAQLRHYGLVADFVPSLSNATALGEELSSITGQSALVWYIRGKDGGQGIAEAFRGHPNYREVIVYENCEIAFDRQTMQEIRTQLSRAAGIFFTSASCVRRICLIAEQLPHEIYSIGPSCTKQLQELGFTDIRQAEHTSYESLVQSYMKHHIPSDHEES